MSRSLPYAALLLVLCSCRSAAPTYEVRMGIIADCQYADAPTSGVREYRLSDAKLSACVEHLNGLPLDFVVHLGDFIDRDERSFDVVGPIFDSLQAPGHHVLGNHDFSVSDELKPRVHEILHMPARYHAFEKRGWRFVVLDGNDVSMHATAEGSPEREAVVRWKQERDTTSPDWNGAVGDDQFAWLEQQLTAADDAGQRVMLFCHFPVYPAANHNLWNDAAILELLAAHPSVAAYVAGHNHAGDHAVWNGIHFWTVRGMLDTSESAYAVVELSAERIESDGVGREPDRVLELR